MALQWEQCLPLHMQHGFFELTWVIGYFEQTFCRILMNLVKHPQGKSKISVNR